MPLHKQNNLITKMSFYSNLKVCLFFHFFLQMCSIEIKPAIIDCALSDRHI